MERVSLLSIRLRQLSSITNAPTPLSGPNSIPCCLRAIDEGIIQTFGPVNVSTIDAAFGTEFSKLSQKRSRKKAITGSILIATRMSPAVRTTRGGTWQLNWGTRIIFLTITLRMSPNQSFDRRLNRFRVAQDLCQLVKVATVHQLRGAI